MSRIREPEESLDEGSQVIYYEHNDVMVPHPPLPSGWIIRMSLSKQRQFYCHPNHGSTWHCPVVLPHGSSSAYQPAFVNVPVKQNKQASSEDDMESEDSEMWSPSRQPNHSASDSVTERQSHSSITSATRARRSQDTMQITAEVKDKQATEDQGSEVSSLASSVGKGKHVEQPPSPPADEELAGTLASPEISPSQQAIKSTEESGYEMRSLKLWSPPALPKAVPS